MEDLHRYRELLKRLDPTEPIQRVDEQSWYVERPEGLAQAVARSLQLEPASSHLVVGSIGCGKSTELLAIGRHLMASPGSFVRYVEVSKALDLDVASGEALAITVAADLIQLLSERSPDDARVTEIRGRLKTLVVTAGLARRAGLKTLSPENGAPIIRRPRQLPDEMEPHLPLLTDLAGIVRAQFGGSDLILLLDGLDRIADPIDFDRIVEPFLRLLKVASIGVALVGPRRSIAGVDRLGAAAAFDELHWLGPLETGGLSAGWTFLCKVLRARLEGVTEPNETVALVAASGGVIRMLLQLARDALKETWVRNAPKVGPEQVRVASERMGRSLLLGLSDDELGVLKALLDSGSFSPRTAEETALVLTNRVLEYTNVSGVRSYAVHPTLATFVAALPRPAASKRGSR